MKSLSKYIFIVCAFSGSILSCTKDAPENPYDKVNYTPATTPVTNPDPNGIVGLHQNIFLTRCAKAGCHDGTFEPDYRTVESTYASLVYQPVIKNTVDSIHFYKLRVVPFYADSSFLFDRITTSTSEYMPSNGSRLSQSDIDHVRNWINGGAKNQFDVVPSAPNLPPFINGFIAVDSALHRIDSVRVGGSIINPFIVHPGQTILIAFLVSDDSTTTPNLLVNKLKLSTDADNFNSAVVANATYIAAAGAWVATVSTGGFPLGTQVYMRYYVNDPQHTTPAEFPRTDSPVYYKTYASFLIQ